MVFSYRGVTSPTNANANDNSHDIATTSLKQVDAVVASSRGLTASWDNPRHLGAELLKPAEPKYQNPVRKMTQGYTDTKEFTKESHSSSATHYCSTATLRIIKRITNHQLASFHLIQA